MPKKQETLNSYVAGDYAYDFEFLIHGKTSSGKRHYDSAEVRVHTNHSGRGTMRISSREIPISLIGRGQSKAIKRSLNMAKWYVETRAVTAEHLRMNKLVPHQKRAEHKLKRKHRRATKQHYDPSAYQPKSYLGYGGEMRLF